MPFNIGGPELIIILIIALIIVGPGKLPDVGAALGKSIREFRKAATDMQEGIGSGMSQSAQPVQPVQAAPATPAGVAAPSAPVVAPSDLPIQPAPELK